MATSEMARTVRTRKHLKAGEVPADRLIVLAAFRYGLGRKTYYVEHCVSWLCDNWEALEPDVRRRIGEELEEAFRHDAKARADDCASQVPTVATELGMDCDRAQWARLRRKYRQPECCECGKASLREDDIARLHRDGEVSCKSCTDDKCSICGEAVRLGETFIPVGRKMRHPRCA